jgi:trans-aconitate methyltransferase
MNTPLPVIRGAWDDVARTDAGHVVPAGASHDKFFASGRHEVHDALDHLNVLGLAHRSNLALDFGCGIGRATVALAHDFKRVVGVDCSREMVRRAERHNRVRYMRTDTLRIFAGSAFDLVFSALTLQHLPDSLQREYVTQFLRLLGPFGVAVFEVPDGIAAEGEYSSETVYPVESARVESWVASAGGRVIEAEPCGPATATVVPLRYVAVRPCVGDVR